MSWLAPLALLILLVWLCWPVTLSEPVRAETCHQARAWHAISGETSFEAASAVRSSC